MLCKAQAMPSTPEEAAVEALARLMGEDPGQFDLARGACICLSVISQMHQGKGGPVAVGVGGPEVARNTTSETKARYGASKVVAEDCLRANVAC